MDYRFEGTFFWRGQETTDNQESKKYVSSNDIHTISRRQK